MIQTCRALRRGEALTPPWQGCKPDKQSGQGHVELIQKITERREARVACSQQSRFFDIFVSLSIIHIPSVSGGSRE